MGWTTIRVKEDTKQEVKDKIDGSNMDERVQKLLGNIETYIDKEIRRQIEDVSVNKQTGELEMR